MVVCWYTRITGWVKITHMIELKIEAKLKSGATVTLTRDQVAEVEKYVAQMITGLPPAVKKTRRYGKRHQQTWTPEEDHYINQMASDLSRYADIPRGLKAARFRAFMKQFPGHTLAGVASRYWKAAQNVKAPTYIHD